MVENIRLISLELNNYRQYYGKQRVDFSSREEGFTTLVGKNGEGKSNLLNAISWCFYKSEPHGKKQMNNGVPIFNLKYIKDIEEGHTATLSVKILLQKGNKQYQISRSLTALRGKLEYDKLSDGTRIMCIANFADDKVPSGCEILPEKSNFIILEKDEMRSDFHALDGIANETKMEEILPKDLSFFYLLDGEFLEGFWNESKKVKQGIEQISQLHLLTSAIENIEKLSIPSKGFGQDTDHLTKQIQILQWHEKSMDKNGKEAWSEELRWKDEENTYHATGIKRISDFEDDCKNMNNRINAILREIGNVNVGSIKLLTEEYDVRRSEFNDIEEKRTDAETAYRTSLVNESPFLFLKEAIEKSLQIIETHQKKGELPNETKKTFTNDLLERGTCICHTDLTSKIIEGVEKNESRTYVEAARNIISEDVGLDIVIKMRYAFKNKMIDDYDGFLKKQFNIPRKTFSDTDDKYRELNIQLKGIRSKMGTAGHDETTKLINEHDYLREQIKEAEDKIANERFEITNNQKTISNLKIELDKAMSKNKKADKVTHDIKIWAKMGNYLKEAYSQLKEEIRVGVQDKTWEIFTELLDNSAEFVKFRIKPDYTVVLLDQYEGNKIIDISAGQSLILTLAFVASLRESTGYKFPLVIDSPLGKIDGSIRYNIGNKLPDYLPDEQITFLATDTEYTARIPLDSDEPERDVIPFGKLLEKKIPVKHFRIKKGEDGNSKIFPGKLEYNESKDGWEVVSIV